jgi:hypothetical protein
MDKPLKTWRLIFLSAFVTALLGAGGPAVAGDAKVWVNASSGVYHCPGGQYYGNTKRGEYHSESQAIAQGNHAAYGKRCSAKASSGSASASRFLVGSTGAAAGTKVWVNPSSHVYHCPGTRYYGATKRGNYMSEPEALAHGNRPAYGASC